MSCTQLALFDPMFMLEELPTEPLPGPSRARLLDVLERLYLTIEAACDLPETVSEVDWNVGIRTQMPRSEVICLGYKDHAQASDLILAGMLFVLIFKSVMAFPPQCWEARLRSRVSRALVDEAQAVGDEWYRNHAARYLADADYLESVRRSRQGRN